MTTPRNADAPTEPYRPTLHFRHVFRTVNDGNGEFRVLALQQLWAGAGGWGIEWKDVEIERTA